MFRKEITYTRVMRPSRQPHRTRFVINKGYYTPDKSINLADSENKNKLIEYLDDPYHSIHFAAAYIRQIIDEWMPYVKLYTGA